MDRPFHDRADAGQRLAERLRTYAGRSDVIVLGLPRGGAPVAFQVAETLGAELDIFLVRKLGVPGHEELAMGAIASGGVVVLNDDVVQCYDIPPDVLDSVIQAEKQELDRRAAAYRGDRPLPQVRGRTVILVDDGIATGASLRAGVEALRQMDPARVVVAVPVAARSSCQQFSQIADEMVCLLTPDPFYAVGLWYEDFSQTTDEEVRRLLAQARRHPPV